MLKGPSAREGESMVKIHHEKLQAEKEEAGIHKLQSSLPKLCRPVLAMALQDCKLDAERALMLLRQFQSDMFDELAVIHRKRRRLETQRRDDAPDWVEQGTSNKHSKHSKRKKTKHKKSKQKHKSKSRRHAEASDGESDEEHLEFGSFGIIRESDYALKRPEFAAWATEIKHIDIESLPRGDERELFSTFMEDFNTCTLPHRKYYDLAAHARKIAAAAGPADAAAAALDSNTFVDDERLRRAELMEQRRHAQDQSARDAMAKMMLSSGHLSQLKQREMLHLQAQEAYKTGDMSKAQKLMKQLNPEEEDTRDLEHYN